MLENIQEFERRVEKIDEIFQQVVDNLQKLKRLEHCQKLLETVTRKAHDVLINPDLTNTRLLENCRYLIGEVDNSFPGLCPKEYVGEA